MGNKVAQDIIDQLKVYGKDPDITYKEAGRRLGIHRETVSRIVKKRHIRWLNHSKGYIPIETYDEKIRKLRAYADDPKISREEAAKRLGMGIRKLRKLILEHEIEWQKGQKPHLHSWEHPDRQEERQEITRKLTQYANNPNVTQKRAAELIGWSYKRVRAFCERECIGPWLRPEPKPLPQMPDRIPQIIENGVFVEPVKQTAEYRRKVMIRSVMDKLFPHHVYEKSA